MAVIELFQVFFFSLIIIVELYYKNTFFFVWSDESHAGLISLFSCFPGDDPAYR